MKNTVFFILLLIVFSSFSQEKRNTVFGIVSDGSLPLKNVSVQIKNTEKGTMTDENGKYSILAKPSEILMFSYIGMATIEVMVEDVTARLNIDMTIKVEELDEVVVNKKVNKRGQDYLRQEYAINKNILYTSFGFLNKETAGYSLRMIDGDDLNPAALDILTALDGRIAGVRVGGEFPNRFLVIRGSGSVGTDPKGSPRIGVSTVSSANPVIYDVDGLITKTPPLHLSIANIDRVAIISGLAGATRYGSMGGSGVVIINTKGNVRLNEPGTSELYDRAKLRNNIYDNSALAEERVAANSSVFLKELLASKSLPEAKETYDRNLGSGVKNSSQILDSYLYFEERGDSKFATEIVEKNSAIFENNPIDAKALAYAFDAAKNTELAVAQYENILRMRPNYPQSYRDLANSYLRNNDYKTAATLFLRYKYLVEEGVFKKDSSDIQNIILKEFDNLMFLHGPKVLDNTEYKVPSQSLTHSEGTRLLFEWNDTDADFELQFVNPENQYFTWQHSLANTPELIRDEKIKGYSCEEFFIDNSLLGKWQVNAKYKGNKKLSTTYLKLTIFTDYNTPFQQEKIQLFSLSLKNVNQKLFDFNNAQKSTSN